MAWKPLIISLYALCGVVGYASSFHLITPAKGFLIYIMRKPIGNALRFKVLERDKFRCQYCGATPLDDKLEIDHKISVFYGGTNDINNLLTACKSCNIGKHKRLTEHEAPHEINLREILKLKIKSETQPVYDMYNKYFPKWGISEDYRDAIFRLVKKSGIEKVLTVLEESCKKNNDFHDAYINFIYKMPETE